MSKRLSLSILGSVLILGACGGAGGAGKAVRPDDPTAKDALNEGGGKCEDVGGPGEPLVVDWKPEERNDLELAMREGVAVVSYSCSGMKLLKECHLDGQYGYLGMTRREQVVRLNDSDEVKANLPLSGAKLSAELKRGSKLDVAMVMVGRQKSAWDEPSTNDLKGGAKCAGATHFIRGATVGAFVLATSTSGEVGAAASFFGAGTEGKSASAREVQNKDGDVGACKSAAPSSANAPEQCGSAIRLFIQPIKQAKKDEKVAAEPKKKPDLAEREGGCPKGMVEAGGKCARPAAVPAYQCKKDDSKECETQCEKGHAGSCGTLAVMHMTASGGASRDEAKAAQLFEKACKGDDLASCVNFGRVTKDAAAAVAHFDKACQGGDARGCGFYGNALLTGAGIAKDPAKALESLKQGCEGGNPWSCGKAGNLLASGEAGSKDENAAARMWERACQGGEGEACARVGEKWETGPSKNPILAMINFQRGCNMMHADACAGLGRVEMSRQGGSADNAKRAFEMACNRGSDLGCAVMKIMFKGTRAVFAKPAQTNAWRSGCNGGNARACAMLGAVNVASGNKSGEMDIQRACTMQDQWACALQKAVKP